MTIDQYIHNINAAYQRGTATEHTYRGDLKQLIESIVPTINATNEPKRQSCGAPDYILTKKDIPVGFIEAKDIADKDLAGAKKTGNKEQFDRYKASLNNLIFTDYLDFHLYINGEFVTSVAIARLEFPSSGGVPNGRGGIIIPLPQNFSSFENLLKDFCTHISQSIKSSKKLAEMMAGKARLLSEVIEKALTSDETHNEDSTLKDQMNAFKQILIHDITPKGFADVYAQTIAYGMFAARLHDPTLPTFSRQEAAELIPKTNPFLRKLFGYIAGPDIDDRIKWIVDSLVDVFLACNVAEILQSYGKTTKMEDPIIHFYETFLSEYDPALRKARGVWYTPTPVVNFIVRAVDDILKTEFDLPQGLADNSKISVPIGNVPPRPLGTPPKEGNSREQIQDGDSNTDKKRIKNSVPPSNLPPRNSPSLALSGVEVVEGCPQGGVVKNPPPTKEIHRVQLLDPATGTGTFLAEVVKHIHKKFAGQQGIWSNYVEQHLLPRLNGFELLMASYAMAHLQLDLLLTETGYRPSSGAGGFPSVGGVPAGRGGLNSNNLNAQRLRIYLTNSLEESHPDTGTLFANWLSTEANEANHIKRDTPVMCIIGNPPYAVSSTNKGAWIQNLIGDYKKNLKERKINLDDDYIKFIRFGQHFVDKNGSGVLAYISNNSFIDGITHRQMRKHLLQSFDTIYVLDLHGNAKKKEVCPDGSVDQNVFDIMQGVSINIFVKTGKKKPNELGQVLHANLQGKRDFKYDYLTENSLKTIAWKKLAYDTNNYFFVPKNFDEIKSYEKGFKVEDLFGIKNSGVKTDRDSLFIDDDKKELEKRFEILLSGNADITFKNHYRVEDSGSYKLTEKIKGKQFNSKHIYKIQYRPFDFKWIYYDEKLISRPAYSVMKNMLQPNLALLFPRQAITGFLGFFISKGLTDVNYTGSAGQFGAGLPFPLYLYPNPSGQQSLLGASGELTTQHSPPTEGWSQTGVVNNAAVNNAAVQSTTPPVGHPSKGGELQGGNKGGELQGVNTNGELHGGNKKEELQGGNKGEELQGGNKGGELQGVNTNGELRGGNKGIELQRVPNLNAEIVKQIAEKLGLTFVNEKQTNHKNTPAQHSPPLEGLSQTGVVNNVVVTNTPNTTFAPIDILDYIYAVLHSPTYRDNYKEFLKIDFPRVPYPKDQDTFWQLVALGAEIRQLHLLESATVENYITQYPINGNNVVGKTQFVAQNIHAQHSPPNKVHPVNNSKNIHAQHSPPLALSGAEVLEGCLQDGVVNKETLTTINNQHIYRNFIDDLPYNSNLKPLLKEKRKAGILSEVLFWQQVHKGKFHNIDFDRQRIIGNYIVDFYVKTLGLVIEIDGSSHDNKQDYDNERQQFLESCGLKVYRITDDDMKHNIELAMLGLQQYIIETFGEESIIKSTNIHAQHSPPLALSGAEVVEGCLQDGVVFNTLGKVYINDTQYFDNVPQVAWEFYIGGYQPAQKWLKDRKHRTLEFDDILHYQKIIVALTNTHRLMQAIDTIAIE